MNPNASFSVQQQTTDYSQNDSRSLVLSFLAKKYLELVWDIFAVHYACYTENNCLALIPRRMSQKNDCSQVRLSTGWFDPSVKLTFLFCCVRNRYLDNVITAPGDATFWRINAQNDAFFAKVRKIKTQKHKNRGRFKYCCNTVD